jgi:hypothetical protein
VWYRLCIHSLSRTFVRFFHISLSFSNSYKQIVIAASNGIRAQCSFPENDEAFLMGTNATKAPEPQVLRPIDEVQAIGPACRSLLDCNGHGFCDSCRQR